MTFGKNGIEAREHLTQPGLQQGSCSERLKFGARQNSSHGNPTTEDLRQLSDSFGSEAAPIFYNILLYCYIYS
jgi:hypothetical protein